MSLLGYDCVERKSHFFLSRKYQCYAKPKSRAVNQWPRAKHDVTTRAVVTVGESNSIEMKQERKEAADVVHPWKIARSLTALSTTPPARLMATIDTTLQGNDLLRTLAALPKELQARMTRKRREVRSGQFGLGAWKGREGSTANRERRT
jgi:hypothetical protein